MAFELRDFSDIAPDTKVAADITNVSSTISLVSGVGYPSGGAAGDFMIQIDAEIIRCSSRTGDTLNVSGGATGRGQNGTASIGHVAGSPVSHIFTATNDAKEANAAVAKTIGVAAAPQDLLVADAPHSFTRLPIGANGTLLQALAGAVAYGPLGNNTVGAAQIIDGSIGPVEITPNSLTDGQIATANKDGSGGTPSLRTLGTGALQAAAGNDGRLSDVRVPTGAAGGGLTGTYPNPTVSALPDGIVTLTKHASVTGGRWRRAANLNVNNVSITTVAFDSEDYDSDGFLAPTSGTITVPAGKDGDYVCNLKVTTTTDPANQSFLQISPSVGSVARSVWSSGGAVGAWQAGASCAWAGHLVAGQTLICSVLQASGGSLNITASVDFYCVGHE